MTNTPPVALTIAGSDCSAGAGIQADLKTFQHFGVHGLTAVTCVVSETANLVRTVHPVPVGVVVDQVSLMLDSFPVAAVKTGMLFSAAHVAAVAAILRDRPGLVLVVDPVMIASTGHPLIEQDAIAAYRECLLPLAGLVTPNLPEAETLAETTITRANFEQAAAALARQLGTAVLLKGGHLGDGDCVDCLAEGGRLTPFAAPRLQVDASHGTGCTLSAAITARLAAGDSLHQAVATAKDYLGETLRRSYTLRRGEGPPVYALNQGTDWHPAL
jgi:hydroxymethylpyrimidine/phosphomethylpyrimidine kinase